MNYSRALNWPHHDLGCGNDQRTASVESPPTQWVTSEQAAGDLLRREQRSGDLDGLHRSGPDKAAVEGRLSAETRGGRRRRLARRQNCSRNSRTATSAFEFLVFSQDIDGPDRYGASILFETNTFQAQLANGCEYLVATALGVLDALNAALCATQDFTQCRLALR